jgi:CheY-like chemotaxis protein
MPKQPLVGLPNYRAIAWTFQLMYVKLASLVAVQGFVKQPLAAGEGRGPGRQEPVPQPSRGTREAIPPGVPPAPVSSREPAWIRTPQPVRVQAALPPVAPPGQKPPAPTELQAGLGRLRQAFRDVAAVVEGLGALRSLGGEEALIEMAIFAQSHDQTIDRVWKALGECEEVARRLPPPLVLAPSTPPSESSSSLTTDPAPMSPESLGLESEVEEEGPVTQVDAKLTRVLVVDDDPAVLRAFRRVLQGEHEIVTALDGSDALRIVLGGMRVDAIICDIGMPKLDGPAFFSELFELRPQLMPRVVFCTGGPPSDKIQRFLERLQAPLLFKPVSAAELQRAVDLVRAR